MVLLAPTWVNVVFWMVLLSDPSFMMEFEELELMLGTHDPVVMDTIIAD